MKKLLLLALFILSPSFLFAGTATSDVTGIVLSYMGAAFDLIYSLFNNELNLSFKSIRDHIIPFLMFMLIMIEFLWICIQGILQKSLSVSEMIMKLFLTLVIIIIVQNMNIIVQGLSKMFSRMAMVAGDSGNSNSFIVDAGGYAVFKPSDLTRSFSVIISPIDFAKQSMYNYASSISFKMLNVSNWVALALPAYFMGFICTFIQIALFVVISFVSLNLTFWLIEFSFLLAICTICLPWQIFSPTKFVSSGVWQALFGQAIKLFCVVFMVTLGPALFERVSVACISPITAILENASLSESSFPIGPVIAVIIIAITMVIAYCYFLMKGPSIAKAIIVGQPTMETLGTHYVTKMGAGALLGTWGMAKMGIAAMAGTLTGWINRATHRSDSQSTSSPTPSNESFNRSKLARPDDSYMDIPSRKSPNKTGGEK